MINSPRRPLISLYSVRAITAATLLLPLMAGAAPAPSARMVAIAKFFEEVRTLVQRAPSEHMSAAMSRVSRTHVGTTSLNIYEESEKMVQAMEGEISKPAVGRLQKIAELMPQESRPKNYALLVALVEAMPPQKAEGFLSESFLTKLRLKWATHFREYKVQGAQLVNYTGNGGEQLHPQAEARSASAQTSFLTDVISGIPVGEVVVPGGSRAASAEAQKIRGWKAILMKDKHTVDYAYLNLRKKDPKRLDLILAYRESFKKRGGKLKVTLSTEEAKFFAELDNWESEGGNDFRVWLADVRAKRHPIQYSERPNPIDELMWYLDLGAAEADLQAQSLIVTATAERFLAERQATAAAGKAAQGLRSDLGPAASRAVDSGF